ncbi:MAG: hypothetical protein II178_00665, partial [Selenomonadaceae bacterium]|nr:hypothetical protein [Selenomonadaceae bacterium]
METDCYRGLKGKGRIALALTVLLWMEDSGSAEMGMLYLDVENPYYYQSALNEDLPENTSVSNSGKTLCVAGGSWAGWHIVGGNALDRKIDVDGYSLSLCGAKNIDYAYGGYPAGYCNATGNTVDMSGDSVADVVCGGYTHGGNATGNIVNIEDSRAGNVYGGYTERGKNATGNIVNIKDSRAENVYGGRTDSGEAETGNRVTLDHVVIFGQLCGAYGNSRDWSGNVLVLSGTGNSAGEVQRFKTIRLSDS